MKQDKKHFTFFLYNWRVRISLICAILAIPLSNPQVSTIAVGFFILIPGLTLRGWACGHLQKDKVLTMSGPYRYTRNPLYFGSFLIGIAIAAASRSWIVFAFFAVNFLVIYPVVIHIERDKLRSLFPETYASYEKNVPLFIPKPIPGFRDNPKRFSWALFKKNKEIRAIIGALIFWIFLTGRMILF